MNTQINLDNIKSISSALSLKNNDIKDELNNNVLPVLNNNIENYKKIGLNMEDDIANVKLLFNNLNENLNDLVTVLNYNVVNSYNDLSNNIVHLFNDELVKGLNDLISEIDK